MHLKLTKTNCNVLHDLFTLTDLNLAEIIDPHKLRWCKKKLVPKISCLGAHLKCTERVSFIDNDLLIINAIKIQKEMLIKTVSEIGWSSGA